MVQAQTMSDETARRGEEIYAQRVRSAVESDENIGKLVSIDIETGAYELGDDVLETARKLHARNPGAPIWTKRIGYDAVYAVGGTLNRTAK